MRTKEERQKDREEFWGRFRARIQNARKGPLREMDEDDREAANFVIETVKDAKADGKISLEEIETTIEALQAWRNARKDTPK